MSRYEKTKTGIARKRFDGYGNFTKYNTTIYKEVPISDDDLFVISQEGDRFDNLATQFYGNPQLWWYLAQTNNMNTMNIPAGTSLRIPASTESAKGD